MTDAKTARLDNRAKIIDVAAGLLHDRGPEAVTTRAVALGAGLQAPAIYRLFGDKDGLLEAVAEHVMATFVEAKAGIVEAASADGVDALDDLRAGWNAQLEFGLANPHVFRLLSDPRRVVDSPSAAVGRRVLETRVRRVAETGRLRVSEQRAVALIQAGGIGTIQTALATPAAERDPGLGDAMYEAVLRQILLDAPASDGGGAVAAIVAFRAVAPGIDAFSAAEKQLLTEWMDRALGGAPA